MKKFLKAILLSSLFVVISAASTFAADGNVTVSFTDATGNAVTTLEVGETATMSITIAMDDGSSLAIADMPYALNGIKTTEQTAATGVTWQESGFMFENYDGVESATVTATVEATVAGTASIEFDEAAYMENTLCEATDALVVTGNTLTVTAPAPSTTPVEIAPVTEYEKSAKFEKDGAEYYHAAFTRDITVSATNDPVKGIELKGDKDPVKVTFNTAITSEDTTVKVAINILNVPADATLGTITITPFAN